MPPVSLLIKPASSNCNLRCKYCFYHSVAENREIKSYGIMDIETLEIMVKKTLEYADYACTFAFQGGEPTVAGLGFFEKLMEFEKKYNVKNVKIQNALQTNGTLIDEKWAKYLADSKFLVGISLDGPKDIHNTNRVDAGNTGTYAAVMDAITLFNYYKVEYNVLFVVNALVARYAGKVYDFFKKNNFKYLQFIPCLDPLGERTGGNQYSLKPERYAFFLKNLFDRWYSDIIKGDMVSVRFFDNLVGMLIGYKPEACGMTGQCSCQFVVEADGGTYPCDFYVIDEWYLGNIRSNGFDEMKESEAGRRFIEASKHVDPKCSGCKWFALCRGGCRRDREPIEDGRPVLNYLCPAFEEFFEYSFERMQHAARIFSHK